MKKKREEGEEVEGEKEETQIFKRSKKMVRLPEKEESVEGMLRSMRRGERDEGAEGEREKSRQKIEEMRGDKEVTKRGGGEGKKVEEREKRVGKRNRGA